MDMEQKMLQVLSEHWERINEMVNSGMYEYNDVIGGFDTERDFVEEVTGKRVCFIENNHEEILVLLTTDEWLEMLKKACKEEV